MILEEIVRQLKLAHFLRGLPETRLVELAESLDQRTFQPGDALLSAGDPADGLHIILQGEVELLQEDREGHLREIGRQETGGLLGVIPLLSGTTSQVAVRALEPTEVLFWEKTNLFLFLEQQPSALESLQVIARSQRLARELQFDWLTDEEAIFALSRRHGIRLLWRQLIPALCAVLAISAVGWSVASDTPLLRWLAALLSLAAGAYGLWQWIDWRNDYFIVTDQRVIWLEKVVAIYDSRVEAPLRQILSVSVSTDMLGRWLGYGDVVIRTYTGKIVFQHIGRPRAVAAVVEERWRRLQLAEREEDRSGKLEAIRTMLEGEAEDEAKGEEPPRAPMPPPEEAEPPKEIGLNHWNLQLRFEDQGIITYRKHWAVLLRRIAPPSLLFLLAVAWVGARLGDLLTVLTPPTTMWVGGGIALIGFLWFLYQYADWANDLYQISRTHILDVYRKPLGRELRRAAPLENILSTEVDRRGLIGLLLDFGEVRVNIGTEQLDFEGVFHPGMVQQDIVRAQETFLAQQQQAERKQQRREMVEWLGVYHDEIAPDSPEAREERDQDVYP